MIDINQVSHLIIIYSGRGELKRTLTYVATVFFIVIYYVYNFEFSLSFKFRWSVFHVRHSKTVLTSNLKIALSTSKRVFPFSQELSTIFDNEKNLS